MRALLAAVLGVAGCGVGATREPVLRIGLVTPLTGPINDLGAGSLEGAELALNALEAEGGLRIGGRLVRVEIVLRDAQNKPERAVRAAQELINRENVSVLVGPPLSAQAIPMAQLADKAGVPMITQIATHPDVTKGKSCVFRMCFTDDLQGEVIVRLARERLGVARVAVLYDVADPFTRGMAELFRRRFEERGGAVIAFEAYTTGAKDFRGALNRIKAAGPEALFLPGFVYDVRLQTAQMKEIGLAVQLLGADTMSFRNSEDLAMIEGAYYAAHFSDENPAPQVQAFVAAYEAEFQRKPTATGALTYDAMRFLFAAVNRAQSVEGRRICRALANPGRYAGVTGIAEYSGGPDPAKSVVILQAKGGRPRFFAQIDPR